jgi:hypothetical protein
VTKFLIYIYLTILSIYLYNNISITITGIIYPSIENKNNNRYKLKKDLRRKVSTTHTAYCWCRVVIKREHY